MIQEQHDKESPIKISALKSYKASTAVWSPNTKAQLLNRNSSSRRINCRVQHWTSAKLHVLWKCCRYQVAFTHYSCAGLHAPSPP